MPDYVIKDGNGDLQTVKAQTASGGKVLPQSVPSDAAGAPYDNTNPMPAVLRAGQDIIGKAKLVDAAGTNVAAVSAAGALKVDASGATVTVDGAVKPFAPAASDWAYAAAAGGITDTVAVTIKAAAGAGIRNYLTAMQLFNAHASIGSELAIRDGSAGTVLWRGQFAPGTRLAVTFPSPLKGSTNTLLEVVAITTGAQIYVNAQGYTGA